MPVSTSAISYMLSSRYGFGAILRRVQDLLDNLIDNAVHYAGRGSTVTVRLAGARRRRRPASASRTTAPACRPNCCPG